MYKSEQFLYSVPTSQVSLQRQQSGAEEEPQVKFKRQLSKRQLSKLQEEWDKEIPEVPLSRVIKLNTPEWWIILIGENWGSLLSRILLPPPTRLFKPLMLG